MTVLRRLHPERHALPGERLHALVAALLPLRRCITGDGLRQTLARLGAELGPAARLVQTEVPSGRAALDWKIPREWRVRRAFIETSAGRRYADWDASPLHLVQYSRPARAWLPLDDLRPMLHTLPEQPALVPYRTTYYAERWGFCLSHEALTALEAEAGEAGMVLALVEAELFAGALSFGEVVLPGESPDEVLLSAHACHPALANDNCASLAVAVSLARLLAERPRRRLTYRFLFAPGTIGALAWLAARPDVLPRLRYGLVLANLGDPGGLTYKRTRQDTFGEAVSGTDACVAAALGDRAAYRPFDPFGYDERQFGSPGFDLPVGRLTRTPHGEYPEYHTSADDLSLVCPEALADSLGALLRIVDAFEEAPLPPPRTPAIAAHLRAAAPPEAGALPHRRARYVNAAPFGEPMLSRRGLLRTRGDAGDAADNAALLWLLALSDGTRSLEKVAETAGLAPRVAERAAARLLRAGLLRVLPAPNAP
ncbi:MAG: DUF4910 domain-containing protein [Rubricoccaceae bacterium]